MTSRGRIVLTPQLVRPLREQLPVSVEIVLELTGSCARIVSLYSRGTERNVLHRASAGWKQTSSAPHLNLPVR